MPGGIYGSSGTAGGGIYGSGTSRYGAPAKKKKGKSWFGGLKNAVQDVENVATGVVMTPIVVGKAAAEDIHDVVTSGLHPRQGQTKKPSEVFPHTTKIAKGITDFYAEFYGPLAHGDFDTFLDNLYAHPLQVPLDVATVASLGLGSATKLRLIPKRGGTVLELKLPNGEGFVTKPLAKGEMRAQLQKAIAQAKNAQVKVGPYERPAGMAAAKVKQTQLTRKAINIRAQNVRFNRALRKLHGQPARAAAFLRGRFDRQALNEYTAILEAQARNDPKGPAAASLKIIRNPRVQKLFDNPSKKVLDTIEEARGVGAAQAKNLGLHPDTVEAGRYRAARIAGGARWDDEAGALVGGPSIDELKARGLDPVYYPDVDSTRPPALSFNTGGGKGIPRRPGNQRQSQGTLAMAGQIVMDPASLNKSFLDSVKYQHYRDTHQALIEMADEADHIPAGYQAIREFSKERVSHMDAQRGEFLAALDDAGAFRRNAPELTTKSASSAERMANGNYLVVPDKVVKAMTGDFTRQNEFIRLMNRYPLRVWRALVLGLRPAWLVNNMLGNTLMFAVHAMGYRELKELAVGFKQLATPHSARAMDDLLDKHFAGQSRGGFVASEMPEFTTRNPIARAGAAVAGFMPKIDKAWEQMLRKAKVRAELAKHPGLQQKIEQMGADVAYFDDLASDPAAALAADQAALDSPGRAAFQRDLEARLGADADAVMPLTDMLASYSARQKGVPLSQAYDDLVAGVTGADVPEGALAQTSLFEMAGEGAPRPAITREALQQRHQGDLPARIDSASIANEITASGMKLPDELKDPAALQARIDDIFENVKAGADGRHWYDTARRVAHDIAARHPGLTFDQVAQVIAIYSQAADTVANMSFVREAIDQFFEHGEIYAGRFPERQSAEAMQVLKGGQWEGRKRSSFYRNIISDDDRSVTVDRWVTRWFTPGYDTPGQFYDAYEAVLQRMATQLGWSPKEVQAAAWVATKKLDLARRRPKWTIEQLDRAAGDAYDVGFERYFGQQGQLTQGGRVHPNAKRVANLARRPDGGGTLRRDLRPDNAKTGYAVALGAHEQIVPAARVDANLINSFRSLHEQRMKADRNLRLGVWHNPNDGKVYFDLSKKFRNRQEALDYAKSQGQLAIWDFRKGESVPTGLMPDEANRIKVRLRDEVYGERKPLPVVKGAEPTPNPSDPAELWDRIVTQIAQKKYPQKGGRVTKLSFQGAEEFLFDFMKRHPETQSAKALEALRQQIFDQSQAVEIPFGEPVSRADLTGLPTSVKMGGKPLHVGSSYELRALADDYMGEAGLPYSPPTTYAKVNEARAKRIANEYEQMLDINDPRATPEYRKRVQESYRAFIDETQAQYDGLIKAGYTFEFYPEGPPVALDHVRLYRGENGKNETGGGWFTPDRDFASQYANIENGGKLLYVDVPKSEASQYLSSRLKHYGKDEFDPASGSEFTLPPEWSGKAQEVSASYDPYPLGPRQAIEDLKQNKHLYVFPSDEGFGAGGAAADNVHPLLEDTGVRWNGKEVTANDMFRAVHDVYGHGKEGVGFRADGEENAWRSHVAMYSDEAKGAMTSETRGQNSWVNYGPHGEKNRTASQADTVYAEQKAGLMPEWTWREGAGDHQGVRQDYAPDKFGPEAEARKAESRSFIESLEQKHGVTLRQGERGAFDPATRLIHLFDKADPSTAVHEFVHALDTGGGFSPEHVRALEGWSGFQRGTREFSEAVAQGFEQYLREGRAPVAELNGLFARWKALLQSLYKKASDLGLPINDAVRGVFDQVLTPMERRQAPALGKLDALDRVLTENPDISYAIYDRVNDALGNFDHMSPAERSTLRSLFPFYSWFKAISGVSGKLVIEQPLKVELFNHIGRTVIEQNLEEMGIDREDWPGSLVGLIGAERDADGRISGLNTGPMNPYMTVAQIGAFAAALASLQPGEAGRTLPGLNPLLSDLGSYVWGETPQGYEVSGIGTVETLPFTRLLKAFEMTYGVDIPWLGPASSNDPLYDHNFFDELARYAGVPYVRVSKTAAKRTVAPR